MLDHALVAIFAVGFPLITTPVYARRKPALLAGDAPLQRKEYRETIAWLTSMGLATIVVWLLQGRPLTTLGLGLGLPWRSPFGLTLALILCGLLVLQVRRVRRDPVAREAARRTLMPVKEFVPLTSREMALFRGVSLSAGIGEELFYRGFLIWYLAQYMPLLWAVVVSSVVFGLAHVAHGLEATARAAWTGLVLAGFFLLTGALWAPMLLHTAIDLSSGEMGAAAFHIPGAPEAGASEAGASDAQPGSG